MSISTEAQENMQQLLNRHLFGNNKLNAYAVLDGASNPALLDHLYGEQPEFACLYRGELEPDIAECAPYMVKLDAGTAFTQWLTSKGWGAHWGIFVVADCDFKTLHWHFRKLNMVYDPETNKPLLFRYYDPRVLRAFLPTCEPEQLEAFFGPAHLYFAETESGEELMRFYREQQQLVADIV